MGEIVEFPIRREGCSRWRRGQATISLAARPACAALAMAFAAAAPALKAGMPAPSLTRKGMTAIRTIPSLHAR